MRHQFVCFQLTKCQREIASYRVFHMLLTEEDDVDLQILTINIILDLFIIENVFPSETFPQSFREI